MRNMRDLVQDYVDLMGYTGHEEVNRIMLMVECADDKEKLRLTNIMLEKHCLKEIAEGDLPL
jgi:hypothetical protein